MGLISFGVAAEEIRFKCHFSNETYVNQFEGEGVIYNDDGAFYNATFAFNLRKAGRNVKLEKLAVNRDGIVQIFEAGTFYKHEIIRVASAVKGAEVEYINILIDVPPLHTSEIRFLDGMTYYSTCKRD